jgi:predicted aspartyl protease
MALPFRRFTLALLTLSAAQVANALAAECMAPPRPEAPAATEPAGIDALPPGIEALDGIESVIGESSRDMAGRVVAPVYINGQGPFRFVVDTGANRSVLSGRLARRLGLSEVASGQVHSINGVATAPFVDVDALSYGALEIFDTQLPVLEGGVFAGELGLLGVDGMAGRRLRMNIRDNCIEISNASTARRLRGWTTIRGELRFGHLLIADASVRGVDIRVLVDTGSQFTLGNSALRAALDGARNRRTDANSYTAGDLLVLDRMVVVPRLRLGDMEVRTLKAYIGDYHIFDLWGLADEPTLLLGMDLLSQAREIAIDYDRALLHFRVEDRRSHGVIAVTRR